MPKAGIILAGILSVWILHSQTSHAGGGGGPTVIYKYLHHEKLGTVATYVASKQVCLAPGAYVEFHTGNLSESWADPQMHILRRNASTNQWEEHFFDDDSLDGRNPSISFVTSSSGSACTDFKILVRAHDNPSGGSGGAVFTLFMGLSPLGTYPLGGYVLPAPVLVGPTRTIETVRVNEGAAASKIYRFEKRPGEAHHKYRAESMAGGVGPYTTRMTGTTHSGDNGVSTAWVISTPSVGTKEGPIAVLINDALEGDTDGDGLGDGLEGLNGLQTCSDASATPLDCNLVADPMDTDGDGISDYHEAIGLDDEFNPLELYRWGANPRHKDIFVEIDRQQYLVTDSRQTATMQDPVLQFAADRYANLAIDNPDSVPGINLHFDVSRSCDTEPDGTAGTDDISSLCGDYGGSTMVPVFTSGPNAAMGSDNMSTHRWSIFHWMHTYDGDSGNARRDCWASSIGVSDLLSDTRIGATIAHELGHNLGLTHQGALDDHQGFNQNPIYTSLMNYAYDYEKEGSIDNVAFSDGSRTCISPLSLSETTPYSPGADISFLESEPMELLVSPTGGVDWNRDGHFDSSVRGLLLAPGSHSFGGAEIPLAEGVNEVAFTSTTITPGAAEFYSAGQNAIWLIQSNPQSGQLEYRLRYDSGVWGPQSLLGSIPFHSSSEPAVTKFTGASEDHLYVFSIEDTSTGIVSGYKVADTGLITPMQFTLPPPNTKLESVSSTATSNAIYLLGRDTNDMLWINRIDDPDGSATWTGWNTILGPSNIFSEGTPAIQAGPDGHIYLLYRLTESFMWMKTYDPSLPLSGPWQDITGTGMSSLWKTHNDDCAMSLGRPGFIYQPHVDSTGTPLTRGTGAFWMWYRATCPGGETKTFIRQSNGHLSPAGRGSDFNMGSYHYTPIPGDSTAGTFDTCPGQLDTGVALAAGPTGIEAFAPQDVSYTKNGNSCSTDSVIHFPHANGYADVDVCDYDDLSTIDYYLPLSVEFKAVCPSPESFPFEYCNAPQP